MGTVITEMSSWTALTWQTGMKTAFETKNIKSNYFGTFIMKILRFKSDLRKCTFEKILSYKIRFSLNMVLVLLCVSMHFRTILKGSHKKGKWQTFFYCLKKTMIII